MFKLIEPMPSPNGTNKAGLFIASPENIQAAYDAMPRKLRQAFDAMPRRRARDEEENGETNGEKMSAETAVKLIDYFTKAGMPLDKVNDFRAMISPYCEDLSGAGGEDNEEDEPSPGGLELRLQRERDRDDPQKMQAAMDARTEARLLREHRARRAMALDTGAKGFFDQFPEAAHIRRV